MNNSLHPTSVRRLMSMAGAVVLMAASAGFAQSEKSLTGSFDQPLQADGDGQASGGSTMMMSESDGDHNYSVRVQNGKVVSAEVDGKKIPKNRVRNKDGKVEILDEDGSVLKSFNVQTMEGAHGMRFEAVPGGLFQVRPRAQGQGGAGNNLSGAFTGMVQPPVMMGITMSDPGDGEEGVVVASVIDGLPADKAGLEVGDRITSVDGKKLDGQLKLRDILKDKQPGDTVELKVDRDGKNKTIKIKLAKFEASKLRMEEGAGQPDLSWLPADGHQAIEDAKRAIQKALDDIAANENLKPDKIKAKANDALRSALEALEKAKDQMSSGLNELHGNLMKQFGDGQQQKLYSDGGKGGTFVVPGTPAESGVGRQLDKLSEQIERLNKRLDQIEKDRR